MMSWKKTKNFSSRPRLFRQEPEENRRANTIDENGGKAWNGELRDERLALLRAAIFERERDWVTVE